MWFDTEKKLIKKASNGDQYAYARLFERHRDRVFHYVLRLTGNVSDAEDVTQETFISLYRTIASYRGECPFIHFLLKIAHFRCMDLFRKKRNHEPWGEQHDSASEACPATEQYQMQQQQADVVQAMQQLPLEPRLVIELKFFQQLTFAEIAEQLGISENTVKSRFYSVLRNMKPVLEAEHG